MPVMPTTRFFREQPLGLLVLAIVYEPRYADINQVMHLILSYCAMGIYPRASITECISAQKFKTVLAVPLGSPWLRDLRFVIGSYHQ